MRPVADYHNHTFLCGHASGEPYQYVDQALALKLEEIGFSDHAPLVSHEDSRITMSYDQLPLYHRMLEDLKEQYKHADINIKIGIEADFIPGFEDKTRAILESYPYDYVIGSVHFIRDFPFDNPKHKDRLKTEDINQVYRDYNVLLRESANTGLFDIIGHIDLVKKFGDKPTEDLRSDFQKTAEVFFANDVTIEINSSGLRKPVQEIYPALDILKIYCQAGVRITFGSDAHAPGEVGYAFDQAAFLAKKAGYKEYACFKKRKIFKVIEL